MIGEIGQFSLIAAHADGESPRDGGAAPVQLQARRFVGAMTPQFKLSGEPEAVLGARHSRSGNATPRSSDLRGTLGPVKTGWRDHRLVIDEVVP